MLGDVMTGSVNSGHKMSPVHDDEGGRREVRWSVLGLNPIKLSSIRH
jgi:hypothetical protein